MLKSINTLKCFSLNWIVTKPQNILCLALMMLLLILLIISNLYNTNYASVNPAVFYSLEKLPYSFQVGNKLIGDGEMTICLEKNKISGKAIGIGKTNTYNIKLYSSIDGTLDLHKGSINININGDGNINQAFLGGKISFQGPLKGLFRHRDSKLIGEVNIKGKVARLAGFKKYEKILIVIKDPSFTSTLKDFKKNSAYLATSNYGRP